MAAGDYEVEVKAERFKFEIRGEAFNAFNRAGRGGLVTDLNNPLFGRLTGQQYTPSVQLAGRFELANTRGREKAPLP